MRYLHPVAVTEKFIAKGVYRFYENNVLLPKTETWTRHRLAGGGLLTRVDREHEAKGLTTLIEVLTDDSGRLERLNVREWNKSPQAEYRTLRADYIFFLNYVQMSRRLDDGDTQHEEVQFSPDHTLIMLPVAVFDSSAFQHMAHHPGTRFTFLHPIWWAKDTSLLEIFKDIPQLDFAFGDLNDLTPLYNKIPTKVYYAAMNRFIGVDEHDIPIQREDHENKTITVLTEYAHI